MFPCIDRLHNFRRKDPVMYRNKSVSYVCPRPEKSVQRHVSPGTKEQMHAPEKKQQQETFFLRENLVGTIRKVYHIGFAIGN